MVILMFMCVLPGSAKLQIRGRADATRVLQGHPGRQGQRAVVEEVHLQDHLAAGRPRSGVLQVAELPGAARMKRPWPSRLAVHLTNPGVPL